MKNASVLIACAMTVMTALPARADEIVPEETNTCVMAALKALPGTLTVSSGGEWINEVGSTKFVGKVIFYFWWSKDHTSTLGPLTITLTKSGTEYVLSEMLRAGAMPARTTLGSFLNRDAKDNPLFGAFEALESKCNVFYRGGRNTTAE